MAANSLAAARLHLKYRHGALFTPPGGDFIFMLWEDGRCRPSPVYPVRLRKGAAEAEHATRLAVWRPIWCDSVAEARRRAREAFGEEGWFEACDAVEAFRALPTEELVTLALTTWTTGGLKPSPRNPPGPLRAILPTLYDRMQRKRPITDPITISVRLMICYALRLAMMDERFGTDRPTPVPGKGHNQPTKDLRRLHGLHDPNIAHAVTERMYRYFGPQLGLSLDQTEAARDFCRAYGINPSDLSIAELAALWEGGLEELERARVDRNLGRRDMLERFYYAQK